MQDFKVKRKKYITVPDRVRKALIAEFDVTRECVRLALNYKTDGIQPEAIRERAIAMGGFESFKAV